MIPINGRKEHFTGAATEYLAASIFLKRGCQVFFPCMQQGAVDFVVEVGNQLKRVQVKTATWNTSGNYKYLQVRIRPTNKYQQFLPKELYDLLVTVAPDGRMWEIPSEVLTSSNICLDNTGKGVTTWTPYLVNQ